MQRLTKRNKAKQSRTKQNKTRKRQCIFEYIDWKAEEAGYFRVLRGTSPASYCAGLKNPSKNAHLQLSSSLRLWTNSSAMMSGLQPILFFFFSSIEKAFIVEISKTDISGCEKEQWGLPSACAESWGRIEAGAHGSPWPMVGVAVGSQPTQKSTSALHRAECITSVHWCVVGCFAFLLFCF